MIKKLLSFIMMFATTFCLVSGCKDEDNGDQSVLVVDGEEVVATINNVNYTASQVFGDLVVSTSSAQYLYENMEKLLISSVMPISNSKKVEFENDVAKWKKEIEENSVRNGTSYKDDLAAALKNEGVSSEEELLEKKILEWQEKMISKKYWEEKEQTYYEDYLKNGYMYHISQILVTVSSNSYSDMANYIDATITSDQAKKLYDVINALQNGESFYNVAIKYSDDANSKNKGGDLGLVTLYDTSLSDEVKYALANYSVYLEGADLGREEYLDEVYKDGIEAIPQDYVDMLGEKYSETTKYLNNTSQTNKLDQPKEKDRVLARRIIFNNLFNSKTFKFLQTDSEDYSVSMNNVRMPLVDTNGYAPKTTQNVLVNDEGLPILVVRSSSGIHLISITMTPFMDEETLFTYYSKEIDDKDNIKSYLERAVDDSDESARLAKLESFAKDYASMKINGNSNFTGNEEFIRYDMFEYYLNNSAGKFSITNETVKKIIIKYIDSQKKLTEAKISNYFNSGYDKHVNLVNYSDSSLLVKQIPILSCLNKDGNDKPMCTYTYEGGFVKYDSTGGAQ